MRVLLTLIALLAAVGAVFALRPDIDLAVTHFFYDRGGFLGASVAARFARDVFRIAPFVVLAIFVALYLQRRFGARAEAWLTRRASRVGGLGAPLARAAVALQRRLAALRWAPDGRAIVFLVASIAIGSGLIVNLGMKDHLHRPRPVQTQDFGGPDEFRPWYRFDGACKKNCGFPSGEASSGFWMVAPAMLLPPPAQAPALAGALVFGAAASALRLAFGGHYLSDVLMGGLISLIVVFGVRRVLWPRGAP
jgi:membrane-associated phospholipid phosphatase